MSAARDEILARVRAALGPGAAVPEVPRGYRGPRAAADAGATCFCERVAEYRATVTRVSAGELEAALVAELPRARGSPSPRRRCRTCSAAWRP